MAAGKRFRCWILGLSCTVFPLAGCAQAPAHNSGGLFSWFRSRPLSEREMAQQEQHQAARRLQDPAHLHLKYAQWRENVGDLADARQSYHSALKENPKSLEAKLGLARLDQLAGRTDEAEAGFRKALDSRPGDPQALNALGQFYASQKLWSKSLPLLEEAAEAAPNEVTYRYHYAVAVAQSGDLNGAFPHFQRAVGEAEAHYNLGYLLHEKGHLELARQRFQRAIALNPKLIQAQAMLDDLEPKPKKTEVAQAPTQRPPAAANPIQQTSAANLPPVRKIEHAAVTQQEQATWAPVHPPGSLPQPEPPLAQVAAPVSQWTPPMSGTPFSQPGPPHVSKPEEIASAPPNPVHNPPAFRPTQKQHWNQTDASHHASEFLPPSSPEANAESAPATPGFTPPITAAQREQWENQIKAVP
jgi:tetratricopeptide (TPR) repeat protein